MPQHPSTAQDCGRCALPVPVCETVVDTFSRGGRATFKKILLYSNHPELEMGKSERLNWELGHLAEPHHCNTHRL